MIMRGVIPLLVFPNSSGSVVGDGIGVCVGVGEGVGVGAIPLMMCTSPQTSS